jgi:excisionase family DNA binding protein
MSEPSIEPVLISVGEAARMLSMSTRVVYELANEGKLTKRYLTDEARNFRLEAQQVKEYALSLPTESSPR